ncbi:MAG: DUF3108 domain-containing protein [Burkholderiaceae bacterium]
MAGDLKPRVGRRRAAWLALVAGVLLAHAIVTREVAQRMRDFNLEQAMPARIEVAYVRELEPTAPPPAAPIAAAPPPAAQRAAPPQRAASAPKAKPKPKPKPKVEPAPEPEPPPEVLAQAPPASRVDLPPEPAATPSEVAASAPVVAEAASAADPAPFASAASAGSGNRFEWPNSTRVSYVLTGNVRGEVAGDAQVQWIRADNRYQVHLDITVGPAFAPVVTRRMSSDGELTEHGLAPRRYDEDTKAAFRDRRRLTMFFEPDAIVMADGQRRERLPGVQDTASQFIHLSYLFATRPELLRVGGTVEVPLALPRKIDRWIYDVLGEDVVMAPFGPLQTFHLKPRRAVQKSGDLVAEIWFAPALRYLPVRIRIEQDPTTFIDLVIARRPELAGP